MWFMRRTSGGPVDWIVVGLGNPGSKYENTRHNAGFLALDVLAERSGVPIKRLKFQSLCGEGTVGGQRVLLIKPQTFMNNSGVAIHQAVTFYKVPPERVLVIYDDVSLPLGRLRLRAKGSDGGHNGIKSILYQLKSDTFPRIKIGVDSPPHPEYSMIDWVTSAFLPAETKPMALAAARTDRKSTRLNSSH